MKTALRWIFLLPLSALGAFASYLLVKLWLFFSPWFPWEWLLRLATWWTEVMASVVMGVVFITVAYQTAPRGKIIVVYAVAVLGLLFIAGCTWADITINHHEFKTASVVSTVIGLIYGLAEAHKEERNAKRVAE
ncbi:MAG: hypothetical protein PSV13_16075 [Lacunisphaera sp.]|nr:hypothetical protein [Lacunisphaera sp.]